MTRTGRPIKTPRINKVCPTCTVTFATALYEDKKFCSKKCSAFLKHANKKCVVCGKPALNHGKKKYCSQKCYNTTKPGRPGKPTHGLHGSKEYGIWRGIKKRCRLKSNKEYQKYYGSRGIQVCDRWFNSFESFYADMGPIPSPDHSIDRIDNNGNYEPGNCRWATRHEQGSNKRDNRRVVIGHKEWPSLISFAREMKMTKTEYMRASKRFELGWSDEKALGEWNLYGRVV
jgi:predicted nucleic acid-binding Zn ribbon protein